MNAACDIPAIVINAAQATQAKWYVPSSCTIAQWCLESNYGKSEPPGSNNPFGIKATAGEKSVTVATHEVVNGQSVQIQAGFKVFDTLDAAFDYHGQLIATHSIYKPVMAARMNADDFANALTGRYATDPNYGAKLIAIMRARNLYQYNDLSKGTIMAPNPVTGAPAHTPGTNAAIWLNGLGAILSGLAGVASLLPPQYAAAGALLMGLNGMLHQITGQPQQ